jgi:hypothetical protein
MTGKTCIDCAIPVSPTNKSGRCKPCAARFNLTDPERRARRLEALRVYYSDPAARAARAARMAEWNRNLPEHVRESRRAHGRARIAKVQAAAAEKITPEIRAENGRKRTNTVLAWCPPEWRDRYREIKIKGKSAAEAKRIVLDLIAGKPEPLKYAKQRLALAWCPQERRAEYEYLRAIMGAAEAKRAILDEIAKAEERRLASMSPLERQLERLQAGAKLTPKFRPKPTEHDFTLGGIASGLL